MTQKTLIADAPVPPNPRSEGECTCGGKGWVLSEGGWPARCSGCHWVSERHKRLAERLKKMAADLEKLGGPPTEEDRNAASAINNRAYHARSVIELREAIDLELFKPDEKCECANPRCSCQDEDDV